MALTLAPLILDAGIDLSNALVIRHAFGSSSFAKVENKLVYGLSSRTGGRPPTTEFVESLTSSCRRTWQTCVNA